MLLVEEPTFISHSLLVRVIAGMSSLVTGYDSATMRIVMATGGVTEKPSDSQLHDSRLHSHKADTTTD